MKKFISQLLMIMIALSATIVLAEATEKSVPEDIGTAVMGGSNVENTYLACQYAIPEDKSSDVENNLCPMRNDPGVLAGTGLGVSERCIAKTSEEYTYFATLRYYPKGYIREDNVGPVDAAVNLYFALQPVDVILPEGAELGEVDSYVGARVTFDKPFDVFLGDKGFELLSVPNSVIMEPKRVEVVGEVIYGVIVEIGEDYVVLDAYDENGLPSGNLSCYDITPDTLMWNDSSLPFQEGWSCEMIVDNDGMVLAMQHSNG